MTDELKDRRVLELAAKAAGYKIQIVTDGGGNQHFARERDGRLERWNPILFSGDCADMEAELELDVRWTRKGVLVEPVQELTCAQYEEFSNHNGDKKKARRYASTLVSAAIGEAMP